MSPSDSPSFRLARARVALVARRAFTLVELLVVMGIIGIFAGIVVQVMEGGGGNGGLTAAQGTVAGLLSLARSQAALTQGVARLVIYDNPGSVDDTRYLSRIQVVVPDSTSNTGHWITKGDVVDLPAGIYIVPSVPPAVPVAIGAPAWPTQSPNLCSTNLSTASMTIDNSTSAATYYYVEFSLLGTLNGTAANGFLLVLSPGKIHVPGDSSDNQPVRFINSADVRGLQVSQYGVETFLNDITDFQ